MPQPLQNGTVIGEFTVYPNFVTHICDEGFVLRGPPKIKCQTNGTWSKSSTFCEGKTRFQISLQICIGKVHVYFQNCCEIRHWCCATGVPKTF